MASAIVRFQREPQGRGANDVGAHLVGDMAVIRCGGIFTSVKARLSVSDEGRKLIKSARQELRSINRAEIEGIIGRIVGCDVLRSYYDVDVDAAEQIEVYMLTQDVEKRLLRQDLDRLNAVAPRK